MSVITVKNLRKEFLTKQKEKGLAGSFRSLISPTYKKIVAVGSINLKIERGEAVAFIGPNGAGKSTTLKMLTGILYQTDGIIDVLGFSPSKDRKKLAYKLGAVFGQKSQLWYHLPPSETYELFSRIYDIDKETFEKRLKKLVNIFGVKEHLKTPVRKLSLGQRMRCELVAALLHEPELLLLDEPTIGLDLLSKKSLRATIKKLNKEKGITVLLTSHDLDDVEHVCKRIVIINHGKIIYDDSIENLRARYLNKKIIEIILDKKIARYPKKKGVEILEKGKFRAKFEIDLKKLRVRDFVSYIMNYYAEIGIADINILDRSIEEIIEEIYKKK